MPGARDRPALTSTKVVPPFLPPDRPAGRPAHLAMAAVIHPLRILEAAARRGTGWPASPGGWVTGSGREPAAANFVKASPVSPCSSGPMVIWFPEASIVSGRSGRSTTTRPMHLRGEGESLLSSVERRRLSCSPGRTRAVSSLGWARAPVAPPVWGATRHSAPRSSDGRRWRRPVPPRPRAPTARPRPRQRRRRQEALPILRRVDPAPRQRG